MARLNDLTSEDLIIEILSRLPVISLMRFKCVSKSWCSLVQNPHFVAKHRQNYLRSASSDNLCILLRRRCPTTREEVLSLLTCDDKTQATHGGDDDFPNFLVKNVGLPYYEDTPDFKISGICDGIICFYNGDRVIIANPVIRQLKILPESCICLPPNEDGYVEWKVNVVGFGYDPKANDYKVVRVWYSPNEDLLHRRVEVYTLSLDAWKEIDNFGLEVRIISYLPHFKRYWNGAYYWHGELFDSCADSYRGEAIVLFDLTCEVFQYINMPEPIITFYCLIEMNESLALFYYVREEKSFDVWTMEEFGVNGTWTKLLRIGPLWGVVTPLLFTKSDELLMEDSGQMVSYNLTTKQIKRLPVYGDEQEFQAWIYKQSLVNFNSHGKYSIRKEYCFNLAFVIRNSLLRD